MKIFKTIISSFKHTKFKKIVEIGSHEELIEKHGYYFDLKNRPKKHII